MPKYLVRKQGNKLDIVHVPKNLSKPKQEIFQHNRKTIFKNFKEVTAKSEIAALSKVAGGSLRKKPGEKWHSDEAF